MEDLELEYNRIISLKKVTYNQKKGMLLERASDFALNKLEIPHKSNPFDESYAEKEGQGIDLEIYTPEGLGVGEAKNTKSYEFFSPFWIGREILRRFMNKFFLFKLLIVSFLNGSLLKMEKEGYRIISLGYQVLTYLDFKRAINDLIHKLYFIKMRYFNRDIKKSVHKDSVNLTNYPMSSKESNYLSTTNITTKINYNLDKDSKIEYKKGKIFDLASWVLSL